MHFLPITATEMNVIIPFYHHRPVCDRNNPMTHTLTAPVHGNTACDSQSTHR